MIYLLFICGICSVKGYGTGAPQTACTSLQPGHGSQQSGNTFSITADSSAFTPGDTITGEFLYSSITIELFTLSYIEKICKILSYD